MFGRSFQPSLWATLAAIAGVAAGILLGQWQMGRAHDKVERAQLMARRAGEPPIRIGSESVVAAALEYRAVEARGRFEPRGMVLLDNRLRRGAVGYEVVTPLRLAATNVYVLVNRGWIAGTGDRRKLPEVRTPSGEVLVAGVAIVPGQRMVELSDDAIEGAVWQNLTIERYRAHMPYPIQPVLIQQTNDTGDGLVREQASNDREINVHRSYALQWFSLAALVAVAYFVLSLRRVPDRD